MFGGGDGGGEGGGPVWLEWEVKVFVSCFQIAHCLLVIFPSMLVKMTLWSSSLLLGTLSSQSESSLHRGGLKGES